MNIKNNFNKIKKNTEPIVNLFQNNKLQIILTALIFLAILISSSSMRLSHLDNLIDQTTGEYSAADPDALYFLRLSHIVLETGSLNGIDEMRSPGSNITYLQEITPYTIVWMYKLAKIFSPEIDFNLVAIVSPVIFFILGLIVFFFLCLLLAKSKSVALIASAFLAYSPAYLFRTMTGVLDHDALGILGMFTCLLIFTIGIKKYHESLAKTFLWGILLGLSTAFALGAWAGGITFLFMIIPAAILIHYLFNLEELKENKDKLISFYFLWIISYLLFATLIGFTISDTAHRLLNPSSLLVIIVSGFMIVDILVEKNIKRLKFIKEEKRVAYSLILSLILGILFLIIVGQNIFTMIMDIYSRLLSPFGFGGRLGSTVSENAQPYLTTWIGNTGNYLFWLFFAGMVLMGINFSKNIHQKRYKAYFILSWLVLISSILFSRISASHLFNGTNFISQLFYIAGFLIFAGYFGYLYFFKRFKIDLELIIIFSWMLFMLILGRAAARTIFVATPFVCFSASYFLFEAGKYIKTTKDDLAKIMWVVIFIVAVATGFVSLFGNPLSDSYGSYQIVGSQASNIGLVANAQWQEAMSWVRENTSKDDIFVHWWDYGYLIQTMGNRKTVTDGGHSGGDQADHYIGRYVLTTPNPDSALSYMKTWNVSYLLIDPTDLGKYPAYSSIGGGQDDPNDRYSAIPVMVADSKQTRETANSTFIVYQGGMYLFEDIIYNESGKQIFLPSGKAAVIGILLELDGTNRIKQPEAVYVYNNVQTKIPIRYVYYEGQLIDFKEGLDAVIDIVPSFEGQGINPLGAAIYLSPKVSKGLFAQLYLLDDAFNNYPTLEIAHVESDMVINSLRSMGYQGGEFIFYQGLRGPLKIWEVNYPEDTKVIPEFKESLNGEYAKFDEVFY